MPYDKNKPLPPSWMLDESFITLSPEVKWAAIALHMHSDDQGRETTTLWTLRTALWPHQPERPDDDVTDILLELAEVGFLGLYEVSGRGFYVIARHPAPSHPLPSRYPEPPLALRQRLAGEPLADRSAWERERGERDETREPGLRPASDAPSPFCRDHQPAGSGGVRCVMCQDARFVYQIWEREQRALAQDVG
ncbi:MAG: hypothetical protein LCH43_11385 [Actinobacteria bacterium]|nr:hypothetical protein [Actinomycetota bacterium]